MKEVIRLAEGLRRAMEGGAWHGPAVFELLEGVDAPTAAAHPVPGAHSIWELVLHVAAWHEAVALRIAGRVVELSGEADWPPVGTPTEERWREAVDRLRGSYRALSARLGRLLEHELDETVPGKPYPLHHMLAGVIEHDLYHAGQIALLRRAGNQ